MKNKAIKKAFALGMSALLFAATGVPTTVQAAGWKQNTTGWWWQEDDGSYPVSRWQLIRGNYYYFDQNGYMKTGWMKLGVDWYYLGGANDGARKTGWQQVGGTWYYLKDNGTMAADTWIGDWYVNSSGAWTKTRQPAQWIQSGNRWWYRHEDGGYTRNGFETINRKTYYFDAAGWMVTGWKQVGEDWYYFNASGAMVTNVWVGDYYLGEDGVMLTDTWIGKYYVDASGKWVPNKGKEDGELESIQLDQKSAALWIGEEMTLEVIYQPADTTADKSVTWSSSDEKVAKVTDGKITGVGEGTATITAKVGGKKASCKIVVMPEFTISSMAYDEEKGYATINFGIEAVDNYGEAFQVLKEDSDGITGVEWKLSDESLVEVETYKEDYGDYVVLKGLKEGKTTLTASYKGKSVSMDIVTKKVAQLESINYAQETYTRKVGEKFQLFPDIYPENAYVTTGTLDFTSSNPKVATVDGSGIIRTKKEGYTTITATYGRMGELSASCTLKVEGYADNQELEMIQYEPENGAINNNPIRLGVRTKLNVVVYPVTYPHEESDIKFTITKQNMSMYEGTARIKDGYIVGTSKGTVEVEASLDGCDPIRFNLTFGN